VEKITYHNFFSYDTPLADAKLTSNAFKMSMSTEKIIRAQGFIGQYQRVDDTLISMCIPIKQSTNDK